MYLILVYIIILFILFMFCNNKKIIEGQEIDPNDMSDEDLEEKYRGAYVKEFTGDDIRTEQIEIEIVDKEIKLQVYLIDTVNELKEILSKNENIKIPIERMELIYDRVVLRDNYMLMNYGIKSGDEIHLEDNINIISQFSSIYPEKLFRQLYGENKRQYIDPYERYLTDYLKYNKVKKVKSDRKYSQRLSNLFKNKSKSLLKPANKFHYLDVDLNDKIKEENIEVGPDGYIDSPELYDRIIQEQVSDNNNEIINKDKKICCSRSSLNISNPKLIDDMNMSIFKHDLIYESQGYFEEKNRNYYDYMEDDENIFDSLNGSMRNFTNPGELTV